MTTRKLVKCPACEIRSDLSKASCLLVADHIGKNSQLLASFVANNYRNEWEL